MGAGSETHRYKTEGNIKSLSEEKQGSGVLGQVRRVGSGAAAAWVEMAGRVSRLS